MASITFNRFVACHSQMGGAVFVTNLNNGTPDDSRAQIKIGVLEEGEKMKDNNNITASFDINYTISSILIQSNEFFFNTGEQGNAIYLEQARQCIIAKNNFIYNDYTHGNSKKSFSTGGAILVNENDQDDSFDVNIVNNRFLKNNAEIGGAVFLYVPWVNFNDITPLQYYNLNTPL